MVLNNETHYIQVPVLVSNDSVRLIINNGTTQADIANATTDIWNNGWNKLRGIWGPSDARLLVNSVQEGTQDTSIIIPIGITKLNVGSYLSAGYELNGLIWNIKLFQRPSTKG
jgi:hypothetical protein